ncbi:hypothetical protein AKJ41_05860 [candidate division MSBL1 archaeon SCGC-AAA259O05]|uniref:Uroporphyrinogen decarboxylase (URO-D) domain-containing protein n=1 Tax=candidate division MSBL1 archaeon SCGC-AAA259O05 TaxID=1698271 RepID=A0A133UYC3_9EURY|nr:hypothetical protein AKJ41_05860 [candidate division MSBL1 archaeon SCGC-AAA259O05]
MRKKASAEIDSVSKDDMEVLRKLGEKYAEIASKPQHQKKAEMWTLLNNLNDIKPMIWVNEIPWHEMEKNDELKIKSEDSLLQQIETELRRKIYKWEHFDSDMVIEGKIRSPLAIDDSGFGIEEDVDIVRTDPQSDIVSREFHTQIDGEDDLEKIKYPEIVHDEIQSERNYRILKEIFEDILPVVKEGVPGLWFAPWDQLVRWRGPEKALKDLVKNPDLMHKAMDRLVNAHLHRLEQLEDLGLLARNDRNVRIGSGGYGYTSELPDGNTSNLNASDLWGCSAAQIFSEVSPKMHEEFSLKYEKRWLEKFGLTYYGCCEPLDEKVNILRPISNLRKISMSPWVDLKTGAEEIGEDFVFSLKPNPQILAKKKWKPEIARKRIRKSLEKTEGCNVEIIMKDISTLRYEPERLWEWTEIAQEEALKFAEERGLKT